MNTYDSLTKTAKRLLIEKGQRMVVTHRGKGSYDPATGEIVGAAETVYATRGVVFDIVAGESRIQVVNADDIPTDVQHISKKVLLPGDLPILPEIGDLLDIGGVQHAIKSARTNAPGGKNVLTVLIVQGGS